METLDQAGKSEITNEMKRCQASLTPVKKKPGQTNVKTVAKTSVEDLIISLGKNKGNAANGNI